MTGVGGHRPPARSSTEAGPRIPPGIGFGAAYYYEYHPAYTEHSGLERDLDLMAGAGMNVIRVGESVWSTWEPEDGVFQLDWLRPVLDAAHSRGIAVIVGTPTYALPPWLARRHPEIAGEVETGRRFGWGMRQEMDFTHPAFRFHAERVSRAVVGRYAEHPAVVGFQVDNEPGIRLLFNEGVFQRFVDDLRHTYGTVERLNEEWGLVYWSHRLSTWADLWRPDRNVQPQYDLAWRRFQAGLVTDYIGWQAGIVREIARADQFITTCIAFDQVGVEDVGLAGRLDVTAGNAYYEMQDALAHPGTLEISRDWWVRGTWAVYALADLMYSARQEQFLVTETDAASIGLGWTNAPAYEGQWRQAAWALVARGARMIEYWHWNTLHFGAETYWGGVLPHSQRPGRMYRETARIGQELDAVGTLLDGAVPESDVALLYSSDAKWALGALAQSPLAGPAGEPDADSYRGIVLPFYRGLFDAGAQVRIVREAQVFGRGGPGCDPAGFAAEHPVFVVAGYYPAADDDLAWLRDYVAAGGHLVLGPRSLYGDHEGRARLAVAPPGVDDLAGAWYEEFATLTEPVPVAAVPGGLEFEAPAAGTRWADGLLPGAPGVPGPGGDAPRATREDARVLAGYDHPHYGRFAAATTRHEGLGRLTLVGTVPDQEFGRALGRWLAPEPVAAVRGDSPSVRATSARLADGGRAVVVHNWAWQSATAYVAADARDAVTGEVVRGGLLDLGPWDVRVLLSR